MKNYLMLIALCMLANLTNAQEKKLREDMFPKNAKYFIKGGAEIPYAKIDSVIKSWRGTFQVEKSVDGKEQNIYLVKMDPSIELREAQKANKMIGKAAPHFELTDINKKKYSLQDLKGKVVVLNFWFVGCIPCKDEMPELNKLVEKYKGKNVVFLGIGNDNAQQIKEFLKSNTFKYTLLSVGRKTAIDYKVAGYPASMVIDKNGVIRYSQLGGMNIVKSLSREIDKQL